MKNNIKSKLAAEYSARFPKSGHTAVAKLLLSDHPDVFKNLINTLSVVRYVRGKSGKANRLKKSNVISKGMRKPETAPRLPKILLFDLETAPMKGYFWSIYQKYIQPECVTNDWFVLCWSAKWLFKDEMINASCTKKEVSKENDKRIMTDLWKLLDEADVVIAHNLEKFDKKKANTRFFKYGLGLPSSYLTIDTLLHARKQFAISSNKLDYISQKFLGIEGKMKTSMQLWIDILEDTNRGQWKIDGKPMEPMQYMQDYCDQDIYVLEDVYLAMRGYMQPHVNIGLLTEGDEPKCPTCGSTKLSHSGEYHTTVNTFELLRCGDCKATSRGRKTLLSRENSKGVLSSVPR